MTYELIKKSTRTGVLYNNNDSLLLYNNGESYYINKKNGQLIWNSKGFLFEYYAKVKDKIYFNDYSTEKLCKLDLENGEVIVVDNSASIQILVNKLHNNVIPIYYKVDEFGYLGSYNLINESFIWKINIRVNGIWYFGYKKYFFKTYKEDTYTVIKNILNCCSEKDGSILWQLDVGEIGHYANPHLGNVPGEVKKVIGVYREQELLVAVSNGILLGVDIETGRVLWQVDKMPDLGWVKEEIKNEKFSSAETLQFVNTDRLVSLAGYTYCEFNLETRQIENVRYHADYANGRYYYDVNAYGFVAKGDYIYYADDTPTSIAIYERSTGNVIWQYQFEENIRLGNPSNIQVDNDGSRIYLNDTNGTLYIFEKV